MQPPCPSSPVQFTASAPLSLFWSVEWVYPYLMIILMKLSPRVCLLSIFLSCVLSADTLSNKKTAFCVKSLQGRSSRKYYQVQVDLSICLHLCAFACLCVLLWAFVCVCGNLGEGPLLQAKWLKGPHGARWDAQVEWWVPGSDDGVLQAVGWMTMIYYNGKGLSLRPTHTHIQIESDTHIENTLIFSVSLSCLFTHTLDLAQSHTHTKVLHLLHSSII